MPAIHIAILALLLSLPSISFAQEENPLPKIEKEAILLMKETFKASEEAEGTSGRAGGMDVLDEGIAKVDILLNEAYKETMRNMKDKNPQLAELLLKDQRAWLKFVESFCEQAQDGFGEGGTMYINMALAAKLRFFVERISYLRIINRNIVGEVVSGIDEPGRT